MSVAYALKNCCSRPIVCELRGFWLLYGACVRLSNIRSLRSC